MAVALAVGLAGCFFVAPWWTFFSLNSAADAHDRIALAEIIDYPAVLTSLDEQLVEADRPRPSGDWVTAPILYRLTVGASGFQPGMETGLKTKLHPGWLDGPAPILRYWSPSRVRLAVRIRTERDQIRIFTFRRTGLLSWCLTQITLAPIDLRAM